jgi:hypothetical protein
MFEIPSRHEHCVELLLHLWVPCLSVFQDFADKVYWLLFHFRVNFWPFNGNDSAHNCVGGCHI